MLYQKILKTWILSRQVVQPTLIAVDNILFDFFFGQATAVFLQAEEGKPIFELFPRIGL
jgi:hypothetical protein